MNFDYDHWATNHPNDNDYLMPYNGSIFELREKYREIFPGPEFEPIDEENNKLRLYKISFHVNLLPVLCDHNVID